MRYLRTVGTIIISLALGSCSQSATTWKWHPAKQPTGDGTQWQPHLETKNEGDKLSYKFQLQDVGQHISTSLSAQPAHPDDLKKMFRDKFIDFSVPPDPVAVDAFDLGSRGFAIPRVRLRFYDNQGFVVDKLDIVNLQASGDPKTWLKTNQFCGNFQVPMIYSRTELVKARALNKNAADFDIDYEGSNFSDQFVKSVRGSIE